MTGQGDLEALEAWLDTNAAADSDLKKSIDQDGVAKTKAAFRNYYGLRASVAYSYGSHDEWNIARRSTCAGAAPPISASPTSLRFSSTASRNRPADMKTRPPQATPAAA